LNNDKKHFLFNFQILFEKQMKGISMNIFVPICNRRNYWHQFFDIGSSYCRNWTGVRSCLPPYTHIAQLLLFLSKELAANPGFSTLHIHTLELIASQSKDKGFK